MSVVNTIHFSSPLNLDVMTRQAVLVMIQYSMCACVPRAAVVIIVRLSARKSEGHQEERAPPPAAQFPVMELLVVYYSTQSPWLIAHRLYK